MGQPRADLLNFVLNRISDDREQVFKVMRWVSVLTPLFNQAERGGPGLLTPDALDIDNFCDALESLLGDAADSLVVEFVSASRGDVLQPEGCLYSKYLANHLSARIQAVPATLGADVFQTLCDTYWMTIGIRLFSFLVNKYQQVLAGVDQRVVTVAAKGYTDLPLVYLAYVIAGDDQKVAELAPSLRQLAQAVPMGSLNDSVGTWVVLCG